MIARTKRAPNKTPQKQGWKTFLAVFAMCVWVFVSVIVGQLTVGFIMVAILGVEKFGQPVWTAVYSALSYVLGLVLVILVPTKLLPKQKESKRRPKDTDNKKTEVRKELGLFGWPTWTDIGLAPVGFIVSLILAAVMVAIFSLFPWFDAEQMQDVGFNAYLVGFDRIVAFFTLVVVAPVAEEIIFRGWLYGKVRERLSDKVPEWTGMLIAILVVSVLFGIVHLQWNVGVNVFALSVVLCALREVTGTIYAGILTHMIKNGVAFYLLYVLGVG